MTRSLSLINGHSSSTPVLALEQNRRVEDPFQNSAESARLIPAFIAILQRHGRDLDFIRRAAQNFQQESLEAHDSAGACFWADCAHAAAVELARYDNAVLSELEGEL